MSKFYLGKVSLDNLEGVHPDLVRVVKRAITLTPVDFGVTEGVRNLERQQQLYEEGKTKTLNSSHFVRTDGFGYAVDLYCRDDKGKVTWEHQWFRLVIQAMFTAAIAEGVQIKAGGLWRTFLDSPHFELTSS